MIRENTDDCPLPLHSRTSSRALNTHSPRSSLALAVVQARNAGSKAECAAVIGHPRRLSTVIDPHGPVSNTHAHGAHARATNTCHYIRLAQPHHSPQPSPRMRHISPPAYSYRAPAHLESLATWCPHQPAFRQRKSARTASCRRVWLTQLRSGRRRLVALLSLPATGHRR